MGIDDVFVVVAERTRRQILERLRSGDRAVGELVVELGVSQPTVSKHLKVLREAGLVSMRAQGQKRFYSLEAAALDTMRNWLAAFDAPAPPSHPPLDPAREVAGLPDLIGAGPEESGVEAAEPVAVVGGGPAPSVPEEVPDVAAQDVQDAGSTALTPAVLAVPGVVTVAAPVRPPIGRTMGRAAGRAADLLAQLRRRRDS